MSLLLIRWSKMILRYRIQREMAKNRPKMVVFGGSSVYAAVTSQFLYKHHKSNCYSKSHCFSSYFLQSFCVVFKSGTSPPPPFSFVISIQYLLNY